MPKVFPFRAFRYGDDRPGKFICPPYDIIGPELEAALRKNKNNAIQIELPSGNGDRKYLNAKKIWDQWRGNGVVQQDSLLSFYIYNQSFKLGKKTFSRTGFFCALQVEKPGEGSVLRHEMTLSKPKQDRLNLITALKLNTSPIFGLFDDRQAKISRLFRRYLKQKPLARFTDSDKVSHKIWRCADFPDIQVIQTVLEKTPAFIADGHHRYETSWNYLLREKANVKEDGSGRGPRCTLFFLCPMQDKGLVVFPTHRIIRKELQRINWNELTERLNVLRQIFKSKRLQSIPENLDRLKGFIITDGKKSVQVQVKSFKNLKKALRKKPDVLLRLSLVQIHSLLLPELQKEDFHYVHEAGEAVQTAIREESLAILVPPTTVKQLYEVVKSGELMPQKSTYFYPKLATGLVFRAL